jgi:teichuronic acid biosynthesis glycosyltransferase TuaC
MMIRRPFDVVDAHFAHPEGVAAALLALIFRRPFTITMRGSEPRHVRRRFRRRLISWALGRASVVFAVSDELARLAVALGASPDSVRVTINGVDTNVFARISPTLPSTPKKSHEILSAGRLVNTKGHQRVIRAVAALVRRGVPVRLRILGEHGRGVRSHERELRQLVEDLSMDAHVRLDGWVPQRELANAMGQADVVCLASDSEGSPNVVSEALACGTPVVAHDVGTARRQIPDNRFGFVVAVGHQQGLEEALHRALQKQWDRDAIAAWGGAWTWDTVADELVSEFVRIAPPALARCKESPAGSQKV